MTSVSMDKSFLTCVIALTLVTNSTKTRFAKREEKVVTLDWQ